MQACVTSVKTLLQKCGVAWVRQVLKTMVYFWSSDMWMRRVVLSSDCAPEHHLLAFPSTQVWGPRTSQSQNQGFWFNGEIPGACSMQPGRAHLLVKCRQLKLFDCMCGWTKKWDPGLKVSKDQMVNLVHRGAGQAGGGLGKIVPLLARYLR